MVVQKRHPCYAPYFPPPLVRSLQAPHPFTALEFPLRRREGDLLKKSEELGAAYVARISDSDLRRGEEDS